MFSIKVRQTLRRSYLFDRDPLSSCALGRSMIQPERITSGDFLQSEASYNLVFTARD